MPIFGQVWLWSSLAFLLGALLCWVLVALPARRRVGELENELSGGHRRQPPAERPKAQRPVREERYDDYGGYGAYDRGEPDDQPSGLSLLHEEPEPLTRSYAMPGTRFDSGLVAPPETDPADSPAATTQYLDPSSGPGKLEAPPEVPARPAGRGWFDDDAPHKGEPLEAISQLRPSEPDVVDKRLVDDEAEAAPEASRGTIFTQHTHPIPGELIRRLDESGKAEARADEPADSLVDDLADEDTASGAGRTADTEPVATPGEATSENRRSAEVTSEPRPEAESTGTVPATGAHGQTEVMPVASTTESPSEVVPPRGRRSGAGRRRRGTDEPKIMPGVTVRAEPADNPLPKRVPGKPRGHTPFGVETSPAPEPTGDAGEEAARALFEPIVPAEDSPVMPPPHRVRGDGEGNGQGPFGPGSAMPLPDGASPSPEFTIKASVSAQRYCTPESPQFGSTVAEVWFKTPADAERVGFRPVS